MDRGKKEYTGGHVERPRRLDVTRCQYGGNGCRYPDDPVPIRDRAERTPFGERLEKRPQV